MRIILAVFGAFLLITTTASAEFRFGHAGMEPLGYGFVKIHEPYLMTTNDEVIRFKRSLPYYDFCQHYGFHTVSGRLHIEGEPYVPATSIVKQRFSLRINEREEEKTLSIFGCIEGCEGIELEEFSVDDSLLCSEVPFEGEGDPIVSKESPTAIDESHEDYAIITNPFRIAPRYGAKEIELFQYDHDESEASQKPHLDKICEVYGFREYRAPTLGVNVETFKASTEFYKDAYPEFLKPVVAADAAIMITSILTSDFYGDESKIFKPKGYGDLWTVITEIYCEK